MLKQTKKEENKIKTWYKRKKRDLIDSMKMYSEYK